jgi:hypothetical protein
MGGSNHFLRRAVKQNRQTVGHHDGASHTNFSGETSVGLLAIGRVVVQLRHHIAMHLTHEDGALLQLKRQQLAVVENRFGVIAHMVAQIEAVVGCLRRAAISGGAKHLGP